MQSVNAGDSKDLDYEAMDAEHRKLLTVRNSFDLGGWSWKPGLESYGFRRQIVLV